MGLYEFIILAIEKRIISNTCTLNILMSIFMQSSGEKFNLNKSRFFFSITLLARALFPDEISPVEQMLTKILVDPMAGSSQTNLPRQDQITKYLFSESIIRQLESYQLGCFHILQVYNSQNIQNRRKTVGIKQISNKNLGISIRNFLRYCRNSSLIPHLVNIESFQDCIKAIYPPQDKEQQIFYNSSMIIKAYETDNNFFEITPLDPITGEPELTLYHIQLILGRIAFECIKDASEPADKIKTFFEEKLQLLQENNFGPGCDIKYVSDYNSDTSFSSDEGHDKIIADYNHKQIVSQKGIRDDNNLIDVIKVVPNIPTIDEIIKILDDDRVPVVPNELIITPENPPPYALPPKLFEIPKPPDKNNVKPPAQRQNKPGKKEESAADRLKFAPLPGSFLEKLPNVTRSEKFLPIRNSANLCPETVKKTLCNPGIQPCLIREIFLPPPSPPVINTLIESAIVFQNNCNFSMALVSLDKAKAKWLEQDKVETLRPEIELFFELTRGAIYESCEKDDLALGQYINTKMTSDRLPFNHPDRALVYCGLGSVLHHSGRSGLSLRCYLMAKKIRERTIGGDTIDTATVYNNIAVCFNEIGRFQEGYVYLELAEAIMDATLGPHHTRTLTVRQNIERIKRQSLMPTPEYQVLWSKQLVDPFPKASKKGKKKKGKKGKK